MTKQTFKIDGMDCASCARTIETGVAQLDGVTTCTLNFTTERLLVNGDVQTDAIIKRVTQLGFGAATDDASTPTIQPVETTSFLRFIWDRPATRAALIGTLLILPGLIWTELLGRTALLTDLLAVGAMLLAGGPIAQSAWRALRYNREININVLMTVAAIGALIIGAYVEAGMVMVLFALGEALEGFTAQKARDSLRKLMDVAPQTALRLNEDGSTESVPVGEVVVGDALLVKPGARIPVDGTVLEGTSTIDQSSLTGESRPISKSQGGNVLASSLNGEGVLHIQATRLAEDSTFSRMVRLVAEAQDQQAPAQRAIDRFAHYYTPFVMLLALLVATIPPLLFGQPFFNPEPETFGWLYRGLALLVVACPCALVISTPVTVISAISNAARRGVLIKGGVVMEALQEIKVVAFDKTGTLTNGEPVVNLVRAAVCEPESSLHQDECYACDDLLGMASAVERLSEHPLARAVVDAAAKGERELALAADVQALPGVGITGRYQNHNILIGSHRHFDQTIPHAAAHCDHANSAAESGRTPLLVAVDGAYAGLITVSDVVRDTSRATIAALHDSGIEVTAMLTGDDHRIAERIGEEVGIREIHAELLPADKMDHVRRMQATIGNVAMVGDGINDAPALAAADIGIALGGARGTAQAMETADMTLMSDDLSQLPFVLRLSKMAMRTIRFNIALSVGIKAAFLLLVILGFGTMWMAVLADTATAVVVTLIGMRLLNWGQTESIPAIGKA